MSFCVCRCHKMSPHTALVVLSLFKLLFPLFAIHLFIFFKLRFLLKMRKNYLISLPLRQEQFSSGKTNK